MVPYRLVNPKLTLSTKRELVKGLLLLSVVSGFGITYGSRFKVKSLWDAPVIPSLSNSSNQFQCVGPRHFDPMLEMHIWIPNTILCLRLSHTDRIPDTDT